jgi:hypothetical protein
MSRAAAFSSGPRRVGQRNNRPRPRRPRPRKVVVSTNDYE